MKSRTIRITNSSLSIKPSPNASTWKKIKGEVKRNEPRITKSRFKRDKFELIPGLGDCF